MKRIINYIRLCLEDDFKGEVFPSLHHSLWIQFQILQEDEPHFRPMLPGPSYLEDGGDDV